MDNVQNCDSYIDTPSSQTYMPTLITAFLKLNKGLKQLKFWPLKNRLIMLACYLILLQEISKWIPYAYTYTKKYISDAFHWSANKSFTSSKSMFSGSCHHSMACHEVEDGAMASSYGG
jgi:hypothetical protein